MEAKELLRLLFDHIDEDSLSAEVREQMIYVAVKFAHMRLRDALELATKYNVDLS